MPCTPEQLSDFKRDGFLMVNSVLDGDRVAALHDRFERLFRGEFETGISPDEVNWQESDGDPSLTRQICNGWKADRLVAETVLSADLGRMIAELAGWPGARIMQDNLLWKPPAAKSLGFHRDNAYLAWYTPREMLTCWMALDPTTAEGGTVEFAVGSHHWPTDHDPMGEFHAPEDYHASVLGAAEAAGIQPRFHHVEVAAGGGSFHHGWLWHGSGPNLSGRHRRALVLHCASSDARFDRSGFGEGNGPIYTRYARLTDDLMDENHFPILWRSDGYRTPGI